MERTQAFLVRCFFECFVVAEEDDGVEQADAAGEVEGGSPVFIAFVDAAPVTRTLEEGLEGEDVSIPDGDVQGYFLCLFVGDGRVRSVC